MGPKFLGTTTALFFRQTGPSYGSMNFIVLYFIPPLHWPFDIPNVMHQRVWKSSVDSLLIIRICYWQFSTMVGLFQWLPVLEILNPTEDWTLHVWSCHTHGNLRLLIQEKLFNISFCWGEFKLEFWFHSSLK